MKWIKPCAVVLSMITLSVCSYAQRIKMIEGDLAPLKNEKNISTEFTYDNMKVGKHNTEAEYIAKKTEDYNKKDPGKGDNWAKDWVSDRKEHYEPRFIELFEKNSEMNVKRDARYTLVYKTTFTEPGFNIAVMRRNAETNAEVWIVETGSKKVIAKISVERVPGRTFGGNDYDTGVRIAECYADAGKYLGKFMRKQMD